ncbi:Ig-like domain-containing protein [Streptosporangiaceae bacterium NEAU-GS5]|nr:Ig-like domain-containing protein [Streptosporangiaceae bacterium NEAU-GS5]
MAVRTGQRVELPERFTESMKVWANPDGRSLQAELHTGPIQLLDSTSRKWKPIDTTVVERAGRLTAAYVKTPLSFGRLNDKEIVSAQNGSGFVSTTKLPAPRLNRNTVTYPDAAGNGVDLVVAALPDGFSQSVVVRSRPSGPLTIRLPISLPAGMTYGMTLDRRPQLKTAAGTAAAPPLTVFASDATAERSPDSGHVGVVDASVERAGATSLVVLRPDESLLGDPAVTYPVTMSISSVFVGAGMRADTFISKTFTTSQLSATWLRAGTTSTSQDVARVYLQYVVAGTDLDGSHILNADLMLWNYRSGGPNNQNCGSQVGAGIVARRITSSWDPSALSWSAQPPSTSSGQVGNKGAYSDVGTGCSGGGELIHSIEQTVQAWVSGTAPDYGVVLQAASETAALNWRQYRSSEGGSWDRNFPDHAPILFIEYEPAVSEVLLSDLDPSSPDDVTYEQALATKVPPSADPPTVNPVTPEQAHALRQEAGAGFIPAEDSSAPLPDEDWSDTITDCGTGLGDCFPAPEPDSSPPQVISITPADQATAVPLSTQLQITFSEPVTQPTVAVRAGGNAVSGVTTMSDDSTVATFVPGLLSGSTLYSVSVTGATDSAGNPLADYTSAFTTINGPSPSPSPSPVSSPRVTSVAPANGRTDVSPFLTQVTATLSEPVVSGTLTVTDLSGATVAGTSSISAQGTTVTFTATDLFAFFEETQYTARLSGVRNAAGSAMATYTWSFSVSWDSAALGLAARGAAAKRAASDAAANVTTATSLPGPADLPNRAFYKHVDFAECDANTARAVVGLNADGWTKNSYGWCLIQKQAVTFWRNVYSGGSWGRVKVGQSRWWFTSVIHTYVGKGIKTPAEGASWPLSVYGSREIRGWSRIDGVYETGVPLTLASKIILTPRWRMSGDCDDTTPLIEGKKITEWDSGDRISKPFVYHSDENLSGRPDKVSTCTIKPTLQVNAPDGWREVNTGLSIWYNGVKAGNEPVVQCDTSRLILMYYGGCVLVRSIPTMKVSTAAEVNGATNKAAELAAHIKFAYDTPDATKPPGVNKKIPGRPGQPISYPLTRAVDPAVEDANRDAMGSACVQYWTDTERFGKECDEFPFAQTHEGAASPNFDYSVRPISKAANTSGGARQNILWQRYRILEGDPFWVVVTNSPRYRDEYY